MSSAEVHDIKEVKTYDRLGALCFDDCGGRGQLSALEHLLGRYGRLIIVALRFLGGRVFMILFRACFDLWGLDPVASIVVGLLFLPAIEHRDHIVDSAF